MSALSALNEMRKQHTTLTQAARNNNIDVRTLRRIAGPALTKVGRKYVPSKSDKILRVLVLPTAEGRIEVGVRSARAAKTISEYDLALKYFLNTGDGSKVKAFEGVTIYAGGKHIPLLTDLDLLERLGEAGELSFESIYAVTAQ